MNFHAQKLFRAPELGPRRRCSTAETSAGLPRSRCRGPAPEGIIICRRLCVADARQKLGEGTHPSPSFEASQFARFSSRKRVRSLSMDGVFYEESHVSECG